MKKFIAIFLLICVAFPLISCTKSNLLVDDEDASLDFRGESIVVYMSNSVGQVLAKGGSASSDREYQRIVDTQNEFNFVFDYVRVDSSSNSFLAGALTGGLRADLLKDTVSEFYYSYKINALLPIENFVNDPTSDKWRTSGQQGCGIFDGKKYGFFPYYWESAPHLYGFIILNLTILDSYGIPSPHDIIEAGEWNWENFTSFLRETTFIDGTSEWKGLGMINMQTQTMFPFILGNGGSYLIYENGRYKSGIDSEESLEALKFAQSLVQEGLIVDIPADNRDFANGMTWMLASGSASASTVYDFESIRYPYGPHGNKDIVTSLSLGDAMYGFPIFSAYTEDEIGEVVEYMFEPLSDLYPNGWKDIVGDTLFFYQSDYDYYVKSVEECTYIETVALNESYWKFTDAMRMVLLNAATPEQAVESVIDLIQVDIDENLNK